MLPNETVDYKRTGLCMYVRMEMVCNQTKHPGEYHHFSLLFMQLEIKIPLVQLSFASSAGLKRIPKKRPAAEGSPTPGAPEAKKKKQDPKVPWSV